jgi:hypothetical protein
MENRMDIAFPGILLLLALSEFKTGSIRQHGAGDHLPLISQYSHFEQWP